MRFVVVLIVVGTLCGCASKRRGQAVTGTEIVYPHQCITSDIVCRVRGKVTGCKFDKLESCAVVRVTK